MIDLPDLWLVHQDEVHFDLIVSKQSVLYKEGAINSQDNRCQDNTYYCQECDYITKERKNYQDHRKTVHEEMMYSCNSCDYQTKEKCVLEDHKKSSHEGLKYFCDECKYEETDGNNLENHKKSEHGGVKYYCDRCKYKFREDTNTKAQSLLIAIILAVHCNF